MRLNFESVHNRYETAVFERIQHKATAYPRLLENPELLADAACVALNALPARYIRHRVDLAFYASAAQTASEALAIDAAVDSALSYVQSNLTRTK